MPSYRYVCDSCDDVTERVYSVSAKRPRFVKCGACGARAERSFAAENKGGVRPYEMISKALAVRPDQVLQTVEEDRRMGSTADDYLPDGRLVFRSAKRYRDYQRTRGYFDRHAYY